MFIMQSSTSNRYTVIIKQTFFHPWSWWVFSIMPIHQNNIPLHYAFESVLVYSAPWVPSTTQCGTCAWLAVNSQSSSEAHSIHLNALLCTRPVEYAVYRNKNNIIGCHATLQPVTNRYIMIAYSALVYIFPSILCLDQSLYRNSNRYVCSAILVCTICYDFNVEVEG